MASLGGLLGLFRGGSDSGEGTRQAYGAQVAAINSLEAEIKELKDFELRERTSVLKQRARENPQALDSLLPVCFFGLV